MAMDQNTKKLLERWKPVLESENAPAIKDNYRKQVTAVLLENQAQKNREQSNEVGSLLNEAPATNTGGLQTYDPVLISMVRRSMPNLIAYDTMGVQPMNMPTGLIFALRARTGDGSPLYDEPETFYDEVDTSFSGEGTQVGTDPTESGYETGTGMETSTAEGLGREGNDPIANMGFTIEKVSVTAKSRALQAQYSVELAQDLRNVHGLDAESELANLLSAQILAEINREAIRTIYLSARDGAQKGVAEPGKFDLDVDSNGRWSAEKFKGLMFQIERDANRIAKLTRRGKGNIVLTSSDVASALQMAGVLDYAPAIQNQLEVDDTGSTFAGTINGGRMRVFIDPYFEGTQDYYVVGYKGSSPFDAGLFYCPYVPLQMTRTIGENDFQPRIAFKTRYGMTGQQFAYGEEDPESRDQSREIDPLHSDYRGKNFYYRKVTVSNLM